MAIDGVKKELAVSVLNQMEKKLRFDHAIQRNEVWDEERRSLFVHSLLFGFPFPPVYALDKGDNNYWFLDGKQRLTTVLKFVKEEFQLHETTPELRDFPDYIDEEKKEDEDLVLAGKKFSQLADWQQEKILTTQFVVYIFSGMEEDEVDEMFYRLNNGMSLTKMELTRVLASSKIMSFIQEVSNEPFFNDNVSLSEKMRNRFVDEELIMQIMMIVENGGEALDLSSKEIKKYAVGLKERGIPEEVQGVIRKTTMYLNQAFPEKESFLRKSHIPALFMEAIEAENQGVDPNKFAGWAMDFFANRMKGSNYARFGRAGTARRENVRGRLFELHKDFINHIGKAPVYKAPSVRDAERKAEIEAKKAEVQAKKEAEAKEKEKEKETVTA